MRLRGWIWILVLALLGSFAALRMRSGHAIETDLLAMLPATERNPVAEDAVRSLAQASGNRAIFLVGGAEPERSKAAALTLAKDLEASQAFPQVQGTLKDVDPGVVPGFYTPYRFGLPPQEATPDDPEALLEHLQARLASPQTASFGLGLAQDPLGQMEGFLAQLPLNSSRMQIQDDLLVLQGKDGLYVLCTAALSGSAFDPKVQESTRLAVEKAEKHLAQAFPEVKLLRTGAVFYAIDARTRAEREMHLISGISLVCIFLLHLLVFRSLRHLLLGLASIGAGLVTAAAVSLIFFDKLYLLTLVCGASVLGDAVDYSFLYFANHLAYSGEGGTAPSPGSLFVPPRAPPRGVRAKPGHRVCREHMGALGRPAPDPQAPGPRLPDHHAGLPGPHAGPLPGPPADRPLLHGGPPGGLHHPLLHPAELPGGTGPSPSTHPEGHPWAHGPGPVPGPRQAGSPHPGGPGPGPGGARPAGPHP